MESNYKFRELKIYGSTEWLAENKKKYRTVFDRAESDYIYAEFSVYNKFFDIADWDIKVRLKCYKKNYDNDQELCNLPFERKVSKYDSVLYIREGWGNRKIGAFWKKGEYYWEAWVEDKKVVTTDFYIEDAIFNTPQKKSPYIEVKSLKLYEASYDDNDVDENERNYLSHFNAEDTRYVYAEIVLKNNNPLQNWQCELFAKFYTEARELKGQVVRLRKIDEGKELIKMTFGWGSNVEGSWRIDSYFVEFVFFNKSIAKINFAVGDEFKSAETFEFENITDNETENKKNIKIFSIPENLLTGFQQYLLFFKDYVKTAKGKEIKFDVKRVSEGLEIETESEENYDLLQEYFDEYMNFAKENLVGIINVEGDPTPESIDILRMRLEQQVHNLNMEMKFKDLKMKSLEEQVQEVKKEKFLLLDMISSTFQNKSIQLAQSTSENLESIEVKNSCKIFIGQNKIKKVFDLLSEFSKHNLDYDLQHDLVLLNNQWTQFKQDNIRNQISNDERSRKKAQIINSLLNFIELI